MIRTAFWLIAFQICFGVGIAGAAAVTGLRCEDQTNPLGIDAARPGLTWVMNSNRRGDYQSAYQVLVASTPEKLARPQGDLWDSGKVNSADSVHVPYSGAPLQSRAHCYWKVRVWDADGKVSAWSAASFWTMGLLRPADWTARWITASRWFVPPALRPEGFATKLSNSRDTYAWANVDLDAPRAVDAVQLYSSPAAFPVRFKIEGSDTLDFDHPQTIADWTTEDYHLAGEGFQDFAGRGIRARYVRLTVTRSPETSPGAGKFQSIVRQMIVMSATRTLSGQSVNDKWAYHVGGWVLDG